MSFSALFDFPLECLLLATREGLNSVRVFPDGASHLRNCTAPCTDPWIAGWWHFPPSAPCAPSGSWRWTGPHTCSRRLVTGPAPGASDSPQLCLCHRQLGGPQHVPCSCVSEGDPADVAPGTFQRLLLYFIN